MSDVSQGPGWWQASDLKWYPPERRPGYTGPAPGWWLASDLKWYPPDSDTGSYMPAPVTPDLPRPRATSESRGLSPGKRNVLVAVSAAVMVAGLVAGLTAGLNGGGPRRSGPLPAVAGSRATSPSQSSTSTSSSATTPLVTNPPATTPSVTTPSVSTTTTATTPVTPISAVAPTTTVPCPTGYVNTSVSMEGQESSSSDAWTLDVIATVTNNTTGSIVPTYVTVGIVDANGQGVGQVTISPSGQISVSPGQSAALSGSGDVSSTSRPNVGQVTAHWTWADSNEAGCAF